MLSKKYIFILFCILFLLHQPKKIQAQTTDYKFQATFIYLFTKYIKWRSTVSRGRFTIGVVGNAYVSKSFNATFNGKRIQNSSTKVVRFHNFSQVQDCDILFISASSASNISSITRNFSNKRTLIITEREGMLRQGSGINFVTRNGKMKYQINQNRIRSAGLSLDAKLVNLAVK